MAAIYAQDADTRPSWVTDMIAHIQFDRVSESTSTRTVEDVSSLRLHAHLPWGEFSSPPPSPTGIPYSNTQADSEHVLVLDPTTSHSSTDPESWHKSLSATSSAVRVPTSTYPVGAISSSLASDEKSDPDVEVAALEQHPSYQGVLCLDKESKNQRAVAIRTVMNTKAGQASCTATRQTYKRKIDGIDSVDAEHADKENILSLSCAPATVKRICREKTGTDWLSVLDIVEYGEEQRRQSEGTVAPSQAVTPVVEENLRLSVRLL